MSGMNENNEQNLSDELESMEQDDAIIGRVFRWSLLVMIGLALIVLIVLFSGSQEEQPAPVAEVPLAGPEELAEPGDRSPPQVGFSNMADEWGIDFIHENGAYGERLLPETMGSAPSRMGVARWRPRRHSSRSVNSRLAARRSPIPRQWRTTISTR